MKKCLKNNKKYSNNKYLKKVINGMKIMIYCIKMKRNCLLENKHFLKKVLEKDQLKKNKEKKFNKNKLWLIN